MTIDRSSLPEDPPVEPNLTPDAIAFIESQNGLRQFDRMMGMIREAIALGASFRLKPYMLMELNRAAVIGLMSAPGSLRVVAVSISGTQHAPPPAADVPRYMDEMCDYINDNWSTKSPIHLAAYAIWRLNWIHPFRDGNGRTARTASYMVLSTRLGWVIPGTVTIPDRIAANKMPYYEVLEAADAAYANGSIDVSQTEKLLADHLAGQLVEVHSAAVNG